MRTLAYIRAVGFGVLSLVCILASVWFFVLRPPADIREFWAVQPGSDVDPAGAKTENNNTATRYLEVGRRYPGSIGGISALLMAATIAPDSEASQEANRRLSQEIETAEIGNITSAFDRGVRGSWKPLKNLAPAFLAQAQKPGTPQSREVARRGLRKYPA